MPTEIEAKEITVGKLFSPEFMFKIPIYQRPLSWSGEHFDQLFEDIFGAMISNQKTYFLGSIVLQECGRNTYDLVDGQQRISALAILMAVIRDLSENPGLKEKLKSYLFQEEDEYKAIPAEQRIKPWEDLKDIFNDCIYIVGGTNKFLDDFVHYKISYKDMEDPKYHLYEAISVFNDKFKEKLRGPENLDKFIKYLLNQVVLVYIKAAEFISAYRLFRVLNARGLPLDTCDLLKSENIGVIQEDINRLKYARIWRETENNLGREELEKVIAFIRTIHTKEKARLSIYEAYEKNIFDKGLLVRGQEFIEYLKDMAEIYQEKVLEGKVLVGSDDIKNEYKWTTDLLTRFIPFSDWIPPVLAFYHKFGGDNYLLDFIQKLEKKAVVEWAAHFTPTERITSFNRIIKLIENEKEPQKVVDELLFYKGEEQPAGTRPRMIGYSDKNQVKSILMENLDSESFYYLGKFAKYVLLRIDMGYWDLENFQGYPGTITIEHILPETPAEDSEWIRVFSEEERSKWTHKLGNLVLLSGRKNSKARNYDFNKKKNIYFKEKCTPFRITQLLENKNRWTMEELGERHQKLLEEAMKIFLDY